MRLDDIILVQVLFKKKKGCDTMYGISITKNHNKEIRGAFFSDLEAMKVMLELMSGYICKKTGIVKTSIDMDNKNIYIYNEKGEKELSLCLFDYAPFIDKTKSSYYEVQILSFDENNIPETSLVVCVKYDGKITSEKYEEAIIKRLCMNSFEGEDFFDEFKEVGTISKVSEEYATEEYLSVIDI